MTPRTAGLLALLALVAAPPALAEAPPPTPGAEPALAQPPVLKVLVPAELPPGTAFPAPSVDVVLAIDVADSGTVEGVRLEQGAGEPFDAAALAAARRFLFEPGRLDTGAPVPVTVTFRFTITAPPAPAPAPAALAPEPVRFTGRLLERGTRRPLADTAVQLRGAGEPLRLVTGPDGRFSAAVPEAAFTVVAAPAGHERLEVKVAARPGEEREETFYLEQAGAGFETVVRAEAVRREITKQVIPAEEVARIPGSQGDTIKAVLNLPGAARTPFGAAVILRGSAPGDSRFFVEGQEIPLLYHFGGLRSTINPRFLEAVEFVPGNFASDYGRATGGIVEVKLRDPAKDMVRGDATFSLYDFGASVEGPLGDRWTGGAAFHRSWIDTILPAILPRDANVSFDTAPRYYDYQFLATRPLGDQVLRLFWYGSMDKLVAILKRPGDDPKIVGDVAARIMFHALQARVSGPVAPGLKQETSVQLTYSQFRTQVGPEFFFDLGAITPALRTTWTLELRPGLAVRAGLDTNVGVASVDLNVPQRPREGENPPPVSTSPTTSAHKSLTQWQPAAFAELRWEPAEGVVVFPGLRVDYYSPTTTWTADPRVGARWTLRPGSTVKAAVGLFHQPPDPADSDPTTGNPAVRNPLAVQWSAGLEQGLGDWLTLDTTGFYKQLSDLVVRNPAAAYDTTLPPVVNDGTGRVYGLELLLKARLGERFFGWVAYTYQRAFRTDHPGEPERRFDFDQPHLLTVLGTWTFSPRWSLGGRFRLVSGNPTTPVAGSLLDASSGTFVPLYGASNSARLPAFAQLDVRVDRTWIFRTWKLGAYLDVQNVSNRGNVEGYSYSYDYAQRTPATGLPILPILGVQGEW